MIQRLVRDGGGSKPVQLARGSCSLTRVGHFRAWVRQVRSFSSRGYQVKSVRLGIGKRNGRGISSELTYLPIPSKGCKHWRYGTSAISQGGRRLILLLKETQ